MQIAIAIATKGRPFVLLQTVGQICSQSRQPDHIFICPAAEADAHKADLMGLGLPVRFSTGANGASAQRNAILRDMPPVDIVLFLDDDFVMAVDYISELEQLFLENPDVIIATGTLLADDVNGPGLLFEQAQSLLEAAAVPQRAPLIDVFNGYGCNMAVRWSTIADNDVRFDENLPLYSWAEDVDFSRQAAAFGRLVKSNRLRGVHMATKTGRTPGLRFGYSQVANQAYLRRKGTISTRLALIYGGRNLLANLRGSILPEPYIDRRGRLLGNLYGLFDLVRGASSPQRILDL